MTDAPAPAAEEQLILLDVDGTLLVAGEAVPGAADAVPRLSAGGHTVRSLTNTDSQATGALLSRLRGRGLDVRDGELFTPVVTARQVLLAHPGARALLLVTDAVAAELADSCERVDPAAPDEATHVVIGDVRETLTYPLLDAAFRAVRAGADLLALQAGRCFLAADGPHLDTGAVVAAVEHAAEVRATVLGKPSPDFLAGAVASTGGFPASATRVVGDDRSTDVAMALAAGCRAVQPRTGKHADQAGREDLPVPEAVIGTVADLPALIAAEAARAA